MNQDADLAVVVGGYNSSNTSHLVELLEEKFDTYFIRNKDEISASNQIRSFDIHNKTVIDHSKFLPDKENVRVIITSGASCPDAAVDAVIQRILFLRDSTIRVEDVII